MALNPTAVAVVRRVMLRSEMFNIEEVPIAPTIAELFTVDPVDPIALSS